MDFWEYGIVSYFCYTKIVRKQQETKAMKKSRLIQAKSLIIFGIIFSTEACFNDCLGGYKKSCEYIKSQHDALMTEQLATEAAVQNAKSNNKIDITEIKSEIKVFKEYFKKNTLNNSGNPLEILGGGISAYYLNKLSENKEGLICINDMMKDVFCFDKALVLNESSLKIARKEFEKKIEEIKKLREGQPVNDIKEHIQIFKQTLDGHKTKIDNGNKKNKNVDEAMVKDIDKKYSELKEYLDNGLNIIAGDIELSLNYIQNAVDFINTIENCLETYKGDRSNKDNNASEVKISVNELIPDKVAETRGARTPALSPMLNDALRQQELEKNCFVGKKIDLSSWKTLADLEANYKELHNDLQRGRAVSVHKACVKDKTEFGEIYNSNKDLQRPILEAIDKAADLRGFFNILKNDARFAKILSQVKENDLLKEFMN